MEVIDPVQAYTINTHKNNINDGPNEQVKIFLAGTIDSGNSNNWQNAIIEILGSDYNSHNITIFNPRRSEWPDTENAIKEQILWEQQKLDETDYIFMNLEPNSKSPISLLELGLYTKSKKLYVFCNSRFYRFMNVMLTCDKYHIPLFSCDNVKHMSQVIMKIIKHTYC